MTKKRKPRVYNWIARGYQDFLANTPLKHAPDKKLPEKDLSEDWHLYLDGFNSARDDVVKGLIKYEKDVSQMPEKLGHREFPKMY